MYALILAVFRCLDVSSLILVVIPEFGHFFLNVSPCSGKIFSVAEQHLKSI